MDTFRKWWNKPKADDQSLLARFYFADESLTAVASELDSFDGRAEPVRCSRLVAQLRQGQDQVLSITNVIMDELLAEDRTPRAFRAKFPEEVLQESLAGQLWFGAECLAAGSSIMNRELESAAMRPLAKAVTKSLDNVRNLLREQCLRIKQPNQTRLNLDTNDACTETLCESLKIFDRLFAEFELLYVSAMVQVKTKQEHETQEMICVLFSETLQRALHNRRLTQEQVDYFDPALMFSIPRLAIVAGLVIFPRGPLNMSQSECLSEMFRPFRTLLVKIRDLLKTLSAAELDQLEQLLCTNEDIEGTTATTAAATQTTTTTTSMIEATPATPTPNFPNCDESPHSGGRRGSGANGNSDQLVIRKHVITDHSATAACDVTNIVATTVDAEANVDLTAWHHDHDGDDDGHDTDDLNDNHRLAVGAHSDVSDATSTHTCAEGPSGFFLSNTNLGQLLQPVDTPLTDLFGPASEMEDDVDDEDAENNYNRNDNCLRPGSGSGAATVLPLDSSIGTAENNSLDRSPDSEVDAAATTLHTTAASGTTATITESVISRKYSANWERLKRRNSSSEAASTSHTHRHSIRVGRSSTRLASSDKHGARKNASSSSSSSSSTSPSSLASSASSLSVSTTDGLTNPASSSSSSSSSSRPHHHKHHHHHHHHVHSSKKRAAAAAAAAAAKSGSPESMSTSGDDDTSLSDSSDTREIQKQLAVRAASRMKFKSTENLLHRLFVCIAGVADQLQTNFASDLRQILRSVFLMNISLPPSEPDENTHDRPKDADRPSATDLEFEFRASERDVVIQRRSDEREGSNQSIYSAAEEAAADADSSSSSSSSGADSVFGAEGDTNNGARRQERSASFEAATHRQAVLRQAAHNAAAGTPRTRSLGDEMPPTAMLTSAVGGHSRGTVAPSPPENQLRAAAAAAQPVSVPTRRVSRSSAASSPAGSHGSTGAGSPRDPCRTMAMALAAAAAASSVVGRTASVQPPRWVPDVEAPRCMACAQSFTTFRRRHHCRNCGGVFCGVCSAASAPLPKYGLIKAVRVCRDCFVHEVGA